MKKLLIMTAFLSAMLTGCERVDHTGEIHSKPNPHLPLDEVARMLSALPIEKVQMEEVHNAVTSSSANGYDEEYMMRDIFASPGNGVGDSPAETKAYTRPLRDLISEHLSKMEKTKSSGGGMSADQYMEALENSDIQIYWPECSTWDGKKLPILTFDPGNGAEVNVGYRMILKENGERVLEEVVVDEAMASEEPVWVVNRNDDSGFLSLEKLREQDPEWGNGGGSLVVKPKAWVLETPGIVKSLVLKDFKMLRNYDCWFAGASEFFIKCGSVEDFTASTEAELKLYSPRITDFMLVVRRSQVGQTIPLNVMLVSRWTEQLDDIAFMMTEDDGGTRTEWKCSAVVKVKSRSYGFDLALPFNSRDDIVWRGQLSSKYLEKYDGITSRLGDVEVTFSLLQR